MTAPAIDDLPQDSGSLPLAGTGTTGVAVAGWGYALPVRRVTNDDLAQTLDTSDAWIAERTGIRERRVSGAGESTAPLAVAASRAALDRAGLAAAEVDVVVVATSTPERLIPSTAAIVAAELGITAGAFDLNAACAGFVYGLTTTAALIGQGMARTALVVGADTLTRFTDPDDRATAVLFGDAAGALVLAGTGASAPAHPGTPEPAAPGLVSCDLVGDPGGIDLLVVPAGGSALPASADTVAAREHYLQMDGREVFRRAVRAVATSVDRTLARAGCTANDVTWFVPHQANARIVDAVLPRIGIPPERTVSNVDRFGNTSAASIPLALAEEADGGRFGAGDLVLACGFGAGLTVGTALWHWGTPG
ncbi:MAG TPA: beta-ketoacyl-ACP synthase III [Acidimicrobiales bacterium]|jgi:3-oxoacyl-[acyl-carrier-protein] synthase-3|nr:beta-ketoacyl-ACP synthase III [Acidimicrobiales bacterium]